MALKERWLVSPWFARPHVARSLLRADRANRADRSRPHDIRQLAATATLRTTTLILACALAFAVPVPAAAVDPTSNIEASPGMDWEETDDVAPEVSQSQWGSGSHPADTSWYDDHQSEDTYTITTASQLAGLAQLVNNRRLSFEGKTVQLGANINLQSEGISVLNPDGTPSNTEGLISWMPIGNDNNTGYQNQGFAGTFDGNGYTITGLYVNQPDGKELRYSGLFGYSIGGTFKNVTIEDAYLSVRTRSDTAESHVGGLLGNGWAVTINGCSVSGRIVMNAQESEAELEKTYKNFRVGGIVGFLGESQGKTSVVSNCSFKGSVLGWTLFMGGISAYARGGTLITNCTNEGIVANTYIVSSGFSTGNDGFTGGIVGELRSGNGDGTCYVQDCLNTGDVSAKRGYIGGVVGDALTTSISDCNNTGNVRLVLETGETAPWGSCVGGVIGRAWGTGSDCCNVIRCSNEGDVSTDGATWVVGGVIGRGGAQGSIEDCFNNGTVRGHFSPTSTGADGCSTGGIAGVASQDIKRCVNVGTVASGTNTQNYTGSGGIVGAAGGTIEQCWNGGAVEGYKCAGGIVGTLTGSASGACTVQDSYNTGVIFSKKVNGHVGGVVGHWRRESGGKTGAVKRCCSVGTLDASGFVLGGIVGCTDNSADQATDCYYLAGCGGNGAYGGAELSIDQMTSDDSWTANFAGFATSGDDAVWGKGMNVENADGSCVLYLPHLKAFEPGNAATSDIAYVDDFAAARSYPHLAGAALTVTQAGWTYGTAGGDRPLPECTPKDGTTVPDDAVVTVSYTGTTTGNASYGPSAAAPTDAGEYTVTVSYENGGVLYRGSATFTIAQAMPVAAVGVPSCKPVTASGAMLAGVKLTGEDKFTGVDDKPLPGVLTWQRADAATTEVAPNTAYTWVFTPTDLNYQTITGEFTPWQRTFGVRITVNNATEEPSAPLADAQFALYADTDNDGAFDASADQQLGNAATTDASGIAALTGISADGTYWIVQTSAPAGFVKHGAMKLTVDAAAGTAVLNDNEGTPISAVPSSVGGVEVFPITIDCTGIPSLPKTGGWGGAPLYLLGIVAVATAVVVLRRE